MVNETAMYECRGLIYWSGVKKRYIKFLRWDNLFDHGVWNRCIFCIVGVSVAK